MIVFDTPKLKYGNNPCGVYKMTFDTGHFYYGSSKSLKSIIKSWVNTINRGKFQSKIIEDAIKNVQSIKIEIIEITGDNYEEVENLYLKFNLNDPLCLNRADSASKNRKLKPLPFHLKKPEKIKHQLTPPKTIYQYDMSGRFIRTFYSIGAAARITSLKYKTISSHLKTSTKRGINGFIFLDKKWDSSVVVKRISEEERNYIKNNFGVIESEVLAKQFGVTKQSIYHIGTNRDKRGDKKYIGYKNCFKPENKKIVIDLNTGVYYYSVRELSTYVSIKEKKLYKILSGRMGNTTQYRYA